jgi:hypothetical protein
MQHQMYFCSHSAARGQAEAIGNSSSFQIWMSIRLCVPRVFVYMRRAIAGWAVFISGGHIYTPQRKLDRMLQLWLEIRTPP